MVHTKQELARRIREKVNVTTEGAKLIYDAIVEVLSDGLEEDGEVTLADIGTFTAKERTYHDPYNKISGVQKMISFTASAGLKAHVKGKKYDAKAHRYVDKDN